MENKKNTSLLTDSKLYLIITLIIVMLPYCFVPALAEDTKKLDIMEVNRALSHSEHSLTKGKQTATELDDQLVRISREVSIFQQKLVSITNKIQLTEVRLNTLKNELNLLVKQRENKTIELLLVKKELLEVIGALQRINYVPTELVIFMPASAKNISRTRLLLLSLTQTFKTRTIKLRNTVALLEDMEKYAPQRESNINKRIKHLKLQRADLKMQLSQKIALKRRTTIIHENTTKSVKQLATKTKHLQVLLAQLIKKVEKKDQQVIYSDIPLPSEHRADKSSNSSTISTNNKMVSLNNLRMPIEGKVVSHFNQATEFGFLTKGIIIRTNFGEKVRAPSEGRVVFSGPFHEYGMLLIIDHGAGYHTVLAGLDHIYKTLDQYVLLGEPVGIMNSLNEKQPELYMELRRRGHPINPLPWLATNNNKVSGG